MTEWVNAEVIDIINWTDSLFSLRINAPIANFIAGQFTKLSLNVNGKRISRAYSYVNAPSQKLLEFYVINIPDGKFTPKLLKLKPEDNLMIAKEASGFFIIKAIPKCDNLWMLATGTAIGPYLSILQQRDGLERFKNIILVHAVRYIKDLSYLLLMEELKEIYQGKLHIQTIISREKKHGHLHGRIPCLIKNNLLEETIGISINNDNSNHIMLCGNPQMIVDTQKLLQESRNMYKNMRDKPGHITTENYW
ncbi:ferredoxin--NADP(+) reductase [Candidatus Ishikawella capsulata]|uniref:Flavodoxin/ferredoxin--NADP reductase n=1 Tax=Candidatus Ishikawaella capsulata Mpkobe TaxID=476281 RepID=C5WDR5_9ENTR|nr:ferredoxin--NADP(+) reductase [Candidatus Ishikawaella capsulata]BAH83471.1 flavodoxin-NADP reductase [Candidatus Ishikawaella capsulata Mpkobe]